jgi:hypothetical protein
MSSIALGGRTRDPVDQSWKGHAAVRALLATFGLLASLHLSAHAETLPVIGHVLDLRGDWRLYSSGSGEEQSQALSKWQDLPSGSVIRIRSPSVSDYITIVDQRMEILVQRRCHAVAKCFQPIFLPSLPDDRSGADVFVLALRQVWPLLAGGDYERSMHRMRRGALYTESVAELREGGLDLGEVMRALRQGRYFLSAASRK